VIKEVVPNSSLERSKVIRAIIMHNLKELKCDNSMIKRYDDNATTIVIDEEGNLKETWIFGAIAGNLDCFISTYNWEDLLKMWGNIEEIG